jgi:D-serine deaminase-like pyridoxal phosphate-dependent protein
MTADAPARPAPRDDLERFERAFADLDAPFAFVDLDALRWNASDMLRRASGLPIRVASKSVRCRGMLERILALDPRFRGLMTFTLPETLWLAGRGFGDLLLAYPTADRGAIAELAALELDRPPALVVDSVAQLDLLDAAAGPRARPLRACIEVDLSFWALGERVKVGAKRSPVRTPAQARALAEEIARRPGFELAGVMGYEAHVAGVADTPPGARAKGLAIRALKRRSVREIAERRAAVVEAVREVAPIELVNAGGTGSLETSSAETCVTEVTAGSGFYAPALFDHYADFTLRPAAMFALPVVRRPAPGVATALGGGYLASGSADALRLPVVHLPRGLRLDPLEGAGEVQTPLLGDAADALRPGDRVYLRHAKAGELCERFGRLLVVEGDRVVDELATYRGEGLTFL